MIIDEVRKDAKDFADWATRQNYERDRFATELGEYIEDMVDLGKFEAGPDHGWDFDDQYYVMFIATDQPNVSECVMFHLRVPIIGNADKAYDRAMQGI